MCHGAHGLDIRTILHLGQTVGRANAAAQNRRISAIVAGALALCTAGAEFHHAAGGVSVQAHHAGGLGGDEAVEVHGLQQVGLNEDGTHQVALNADHLDMGVADRALRQGVHIAFPAVGAQVIAEFLAHALGAQPLDVLLIEVVVEQEAGQLALAGAVGHRELIKIHDHCGVIIIFVRNVRNNFDLFHGGFLSFFSIRQDTARSCRLKNFPGRHAEGWPGV